MSEKRFYRASVCGDDGLYDKEDGCVICNVRSNIDLEENWETVLDVLNELADENKELRNDLDDSYDANGVLEAEILKLRQQLTDCEKFRNQIFKKMEEMQQDEKLYAQEIIRLNKEVKDNQFLRLGNDY